jgi:outer membrane autotransporter protein
MRRLRVAMAMVVVAGGLFLSTPTANAQGLNDVLIRLLGNTCTELGVPTTGPLTNNCRGIPPTGSASGGTAATTTEQRLGESEEQRREGRRLAERRAGRGGTTEQPGTGFGIFVNGDYQFLNKDNTRFETGFEQHTAGTTVGVDYSFRGRAILGVALNYAHEFGDFSGVGGGFDNDAYGITFYGSVVPLDNFFVDGFIGYTRKEYSFDRRVHLEVPDAGGGPSLVALGRTEADTSSDEFHTGVTLGYDFVVRNFTVGPRLGLNYSDMRISGYKERGQTGLELIYDNQNIDSLTMSVGAFASMAVSTGFGVLVPQATAEYVHEFLNDQRTVGFTFLYTPSRPRFLFQTDKPDRDFFNIGLGTVLVLPGGKSVFVNVRQLLGYEDRTATTVTAGLRIPF